MIDENKLDEIEEAFTGEVSHAIHESMHDVMPELIGLARRGLNRIYLAPSGEADELQRRLNRIPHGYPEDKRGLYFPAWTSPPGDTILDLLEECFGAHIRSPKDRAEEVLSKDLSMPVEDVARLLVGDLELDEEIAEKLERRFNVIKEFWIERERKYRVQFELSRLHRIEQDWKDAAGEVPVPLPEPGTDMAKLVHANIMMRKYRIPELEQEIEELNSCLVSVSTEVLKAQDAIDSGCPKAAGALLSVALVLLSDVDGEIEQDGKTVHVEHDAVKMANDAIRRQIDDIHREIELAPVPDYGSPYAADPRSPCAIDHEPIPYPEGNVIELPKRQVDGTEEMPEGARDAIEFVKTACGKVNGGHSPIVLPFLCGLGAFVVCMAREATAEDERQVLNGVAVACAKIPTTEVEAQQWIGDVLRSVSIEGCYGMVYVTEGGSVDVYPPFAFGSGHIGVWLPMLRSLEEEIKKNKPINRMPNLKLAPTEEKRRRCIPIEPSKPSLNHGIPEAGIPPSVLRDVVSIGEWSIDRGESGKDDEPVTFMWGAELSPRVSYEEMRSWSKEKIEARLKELEEELSKDLEEDPSRFPHHASIDPDSLVGAYRCLMDLRTKMIDPIHVPDEFPMSLLDELGLPNDVRQKYAILVPMGDGVASVIIKGHELPIPLLREYIRFRLFNLEWLRMRDQGNENPGS